MISSSGWMVIFIEGCKLIIKDSSGFACSSRVPEGLPDTSLGKSGGLTSPISQ